MVTAADENEIPGMELLFRGKERDIYDLSGDRSQASTSSSCATTSIRSAGTIARRRQRFPPISSTSPDSGISRRLSV